MKLVSERSCRNNGEGRLRSRDEATNVEISPVIDDCERSPITEFISYLVGKSERWTSRELRKAHEAVLVSKSYCERS